MHCCHAAGAKVVAKANPGERVGVFGLRGGAVEVVEYSELDPALASATDPATGRLYFNWSNVSRSNGSPIRHIYALLGCHS